MSAAWKLDFVPLQVYSPKRLTLRGLLLCTLGLVGLLLAAYQYHLNSQQLDTLAVQSASIQTLAEIKPAAKVEPQVSPQALRQVAKTINTLGVSWLALLQSIEQAQTQHVALLGLAPNPQKQQVLLQGEASDMAAVLSYIQALEKTPMLDGVYLQRHQVIAEPALAHIEFMIAAHWGAP